MASEKILVYGKNSIRIEKLAERLRNSGFSVMVASQLDTAIHLAQNLKVDVLLWNDVLTLQNKRAIRDIRESQDGENSIIIAVAQDAELFERAEAEKYGVTDFVNENSGYPELKAKITLHLGLRKSQQELLLRNQRLKALADCNFNILLSQDTINLCDIFSEFVYNSFHPALMVLAVYNASSRHYDYFSARKGGETVTETEALQLSPVWRNYFFGDELPDCEQVTNPAVLGMLNEAGFEYGAIYQFTMPYRGRNLATLLLGLPGRMTLSPDDEEMLVSLSQAVAFRIHELRRLFSTRRESEGDSLVIRDFFHRLTEQEIYIYLNKQLLKLLHADTCMYMNYHEGFRFLYPKYLYDSNSEVNVFEEEKPPVLLIREFPTFDEMLNERAPLVINVNQDDNRADVITLPGFSRRRVNTILIFPVAIAHTVQGFFVLGKESILKRYTNREIAEAEKLIQHATDALNDNRILKQAQLTIKQLDRIFEIGTELTLDIPLRDVLKKITSAIRRTLGWNVVILDMKAEYENKFETVSVLGLKDADYQRIIKDEDYPLFKSKLNSSFRLSNSYFYDHQRADIATLPEAMQDFVMQIGAEWSDNDWIYVPIQSRGTLLGMISLNDPVERRRPNQERIRAVEYFANQAAVVMENTELFDSLRSSELKYRLLAETMTMGLVTCEFNGSVIYINNSLKTLLKYETDEEILGRSLYEFCSQSSGHKLEKEVVRVLKESRKPEDALDSVAGLEIELKAQDGEMIPFMIYASPYFQHKQHVGFFAVLSDLRSQKKIERLKSDFNSMIVHDLRSPLNIIQGYVDIVRTQLVGQVSTEQADLLTIAKENVYKVLKLIDNFLIASKLEVGKFQLETEISSINTLIETVVEQHQVLSDKKKIKLHARLDENIPLIHFDKFRIEQVLSNFLSNAMKFTREGGEIRVTDKLCKKEKELTGETEMYVEVSVSDTGVGIDKAELGKVFNKYEQTEASKNAVLKGTGLGLAICREIVELHKGEVWVESEVKKGSTFYFTLPIKPVTL
jgi:PAS domain S-box-containing protein